VDISTIIARKRKRGRNVLVIPITNSIEGFEKMHNVTKGGSVQPPVRYFS
jgi:hypothetical protein